MSKNAVRHYAEATVLVFIWMIAGWVLQLDVNSYLLLGVPLVLMFQIGVRRESLTSLWVRDAGAFSLGMPAILMSLLLVALPAYRLVVVWPDLDWINSLWLLCCSIGAVAAAVSLQLAMRDCLHKKFVASWLVAVLFGVALMALAAMLRGRSVFVASAKLFGLLQDFVLYFNVCFVLEEVVFRGALDAHLFRPENSSIDRSSKAWTSAIFVSALWGIWHLPTITVPNLSAALTIGFVLAIQHALIGVPLSFCWRGSGVLAFPAAAHAMIDAYRNAVLS